MSAYSRCFLTSIGLRPSRKNSACIRLLNRFVPENRLSQQCLPESCFTRLQSSLDATACGFGRCHRLGQTASNKSEDSHALRPSGLPCRGKFRPPVTRRTCPLPIHPNGKLMNQTPFSLEDDEFRISFTGRISVAARTEGLRFQRKLIVPTPSPVAK